MPKQKAQQTTEQSADELIKLAMDQPGVADVMRAYQNANTIQESAQSYFSVISSAANPTVVSASNSSNPTD